MTKNKDHFAKGFAPHTRLKHLILTTYLSTWMHKMLLRPGGGERLFYVDACAGPGGDDVGNSGSPVLAAREAAKTTAHLASEFGRHVDIQVVAIEKMARRFAALKRQLSEFGPTAEALRGELATYIDEINRRAASAPVLFFIDPFGLTPLKADVVKKALMVDKREVLLLFADQAALRHFGSASLYESNADPAQGNIFESSVEAPPEEPFNEGDEATARGVASSNAILDDAFGNHRWYDRIHAVAQGRQREEFLQAYEEFLVEDCKAERVLRLPVRSSTNHHVYHLFHASRSKYGYREMKKVVSSAITRGPVGGAAAETMRFLLRTDINEVAAKVRGRFAGLTVRWAPDRSNRRAANVQAWVLEETPAFPHELPELKARLESLRVPGPTIVYQFPGESRVL